MLELLNIATAWAALGSLVTANVVPEGVVANQSVTARLWRKEEQLTIGYKAQRAAQL